MVTDKDSLSGIGVESLQCMVTNLTTWFADALGVGNQDSVEQRRESQAFKLATLHSNKPLEASTTVRQGSVEIEDHGLNIRSICSAGHSFEISLRNAAHPRQPLLDGVFPRLR